MITDCPIVTYVTIVEDCEVDCTHPFPGVPWGGGQSPDPRAPLHSSGDIHNVLYLGLDLGSCNHCPLVVKDVKAEEPSPVHDGEVMWTVAALSVW